MSTRFLRESLPRTAEPNTDDVPAGHREHAEPPAPPEPLRIAAARERPEGAAWAAGSRAPADSALAEGSAAALLADFIRRHAPLFVLTGAGCSTDSGIPDYRD